MKFLRKVGLCVMLAAITAAVPTMSPLMQANRAVVHAEGEPASEEATFTVTGKAEMGSDAVYLPYLVISGYDKAKFNSATITVQSYTNGAWTDLGSKTYNSITGSLKIGGKDFEGLTFDEWYRVKIVSGANTDFSNVAKITDPTPASTESAAPSGNTGTTEKTGEDSGKDTSAPRSAYDLQNTVLPELYQNFGKAKTDHAELTEFKVGKKSTTNTALYKGTAEITKVTDKTVTFTYTLESKVPELSWHISGNCGAVNSLGWALNFSGAEEGEGLDFYSEQPTKSYTCTASVKISTLEKDLGDSRVKFAVDAFYPESDRIDTFRRDVSSFDKYNEETVFYYVAPPAATNEHYLSEVKNNTLTFGPNAWSSPFTDATGTKVYYRVEKTKNWSSKSFASGKKLKLTGLQYGKFYEIRFARYVTVKMKSGKQVTKESALSKTITHPTTPKDKPVIASVKVSGAKKRSGTRPGYWDYLGKWHPGSSFSGTTGTVTITLKKGSTATHIAVRAHGCDYTIVKLNGKKAVLKNVNLGGYSKGKTVPISAAFTFYGKVSCIPITPYGPWSSEKKTVVK